MSNQLNLIHGIKAILQMKFDMSDEGDLRYTLGNAIIRNRIEGWTIIHEQEYLTSKLQQYNMLNCNSVSLPMQSRTHLSKEDLLSSKENQHLYSQIVHILNPNACYSEYPSRLCLCNQFISTIFINSSRFTHLHT